MLSVLKAGFSDLLHRPSNQIGSLDLLRTIAVLLVMNGHMSVAFANEHGSGPFSRLVFVQNGWIGVDLFFVLSGFFIGGQLWKELAATDKISFPKFFFRRGLRIWPLYFVIFFGVFVFNHQKAVEKHYGWSDLVFVTNYADSGIVTGGWSLSTEEQFYILTPLLLILTVALIRTVKGYRRWLWGLLVAAPCLRAALWFHYEHSFRHDPDGFSKLYYPLHSHCDGLIIGMLISNYLVNRDLKTKLPPAVLVLISFLALIAAHFVHKEILDFSGLALFFGSLVWFALAHAPYPIFNLRIFYWGSRLSYGMYLIHPYLVHPVLRFLDSLQLTSYFGSQVLVGLVFVLLSATAAMLGFCLVEHPFLMLRQKLLRTGSSAVGHKPIKATAGAN